MGEIKQGDIVLVNFEPIMGHEQSGCRPAAVISSDDFSYSRMVIVCPLTSSIKNRPGSVVIKRDGLNNLDADSEIVVGQIRAVSIQRVVQHIGTLNMPQLKEIFSNFDMLCDREV